MHRSHVRVQQMFLNQRGDPGKEGSMYKSFTDSLRMLANPAVFDSMDPLSFAGVVDGKLLIRFAVPGFGKSAIKVRFDTKSRHLFIEGDPEVSRQSTDHPNGGLIPLNPFLRVFTVPPRIDAERITVSVKDGVVTVEAPEREEAAYREIRVD